MFLIFCVLITCAAFREGGVRTTLLLLSALPVLIASRRYPCMTRAGREETEAPPRSAAIRYPCCVGCLIVQRKRQQRAPWNQFHLHGKWKKFAIYQSRYRKRIPATQPVPLFICVFALVSPFTRGCSITTVGAGDDGDKKKQKGGGLSEETPRKRADLFSSYFSSMSLLPVRANEIYCHNRSPHGGAETAEG